MKTETDTDRRILRICRRVAKQPETVRCHRLTVRTIPSAIGFRAVHTNNLEFSVLDYFLAVPCLYLTGWGEKPLKLAQAYFRQYNREGVGAILQKKKLLIEVNPPPFCIRDPASIKAMSTCLIVFFL